MNKTETRAPDIDIRLDSDLPPMNRKQRRTYVAKLKKDVRKRLRQSVQKPHK